MLAIVESAAVQGIEAALIRVEVDQAVGISAFNIVGLPDAAVKESQQRVRAAINNSNLKFPLRRTTVNLSPADVRKEGPAYDLPIALGILAASKQLPSFSLEGLIVVGELSLDGSVRRVSGALPVAMAAKAAGRRGVICPEENALEAALVSHLEVYPVKSLYEAVAFLSGERAVAPMTDKPDLSGLEEASYDCSFDEVKGQEHVKRALQVAAAGSHNVLMIGPPGAGKTMLARRLPSILPPLSLNEALEVTKLYSVSGLLPSDKPLVTQRCFRSPHHTVSNAGLVGGGSNPKPGEISLSHHGVLFLDELPEFHRDALNALRQPLEDGQVTISRATASYTYPSRFMLVGAMNPCPCGYYADLTRRCTCSFHARQRYIQKLSGPLLDRIDIHIEVPRLTEEDLLQPPRETGETKMIRAAITKARRLQEQRYHELPISCNAEMRPKEVNEFCQVDAETKSLLRQAIAQLDLSARAYDRILKLSRTIADLEGSEKIQLPHVAEAIQYRTLDRKFWS